MYFVGHRGAAKEAPENTLLGFKFAFDNGVRCFELDVHLTKDGELAVIHDDTLDRTTNGKGHIGGYTMDELKRFDAGVLFPETHSAAQIPCLEEVLTEYATKIELFEIEIKADRPFILDIVCKQLCDLLCDFNIADKTIITSFDPYAIKTVKAIMPNQRCGLISMFYKESDIHLAKSLGCYSTCMPLKTGGSKELVDTAHNLGLKVAGWVANTIQDVDVLIDWGVDSITSDYPTIVLPYLQSRGLATSSTGEN